MAGKKKSSTGGLPPGKTSHPPTPTTTPNHSPLPKSSWSCCLANPLMLKVVGPAVCVLMGVGGWALLELYSLNGKIEGANKWQSEYSKKVDDITGSMAKFYVHVAEVEVNRNIKSAVIVSKPKKNRHNNVTVKIAVLEAAGNMGIQYEIPASLDDTAVYERVVGQLLYEDPEARSFKKLEGFAFEAGDKKPLPDQIKAEASFVVSEEAARRIKEVMEKGLGISGKTMKIMPFGSFGDLKMLINKDPTMVFNDEKGR